MIVRKKGKKGIDKNPATNPTKRVLMKYFRYDPEFQDFKLVRLNNSGGNRFVEVTEEMTFGEVKFKAIELYFENGYNSFGEGISDCVLSICEMDEDQCLLSHVRVKCLQLSKSFFVLKSESDFNFTEEEDVQNYTATAAIKRKIGPVCSCTYTDECIRCTQDQAYRDTVERQSS